MTLNILYALHILSPLPRMPFLGLSDICLLALQDGSGGQVTFLSDMLLDPQVEADALSSVSSEHPMIPTVHSHCIVVTFLPFLFLLHHEALESSECIWYRSAWMNRRRQSTVE